MALSRIIALGAFLVAFVSEREIQAQSEDVAKKPTELENAWVAALAKADTAELEAL